MRDAVGTPNYTATSSQSEAYSTANTPSTPSYTGVASTTATIVHGANSNPASNPTTLFAVQASSTADATWNTKYVDASGNPSASAVWLSDSAFDAITIAGLDPGTAYEFKSKARNESSEETSFGSDGLFTTSAIAPTLTTDAEDTVTTTSANINGDITDTGGENANERGFAWGTNSGLSGGDTATTTEFGSFGTGTFSDALSSLSPNTTYYFRAYAANTVGTSTGSILNFTTSVSVQTVSTDNESGVGASAATLNGTVSDNGGEDATQHGFAYSTNSSLSSGVSTSTLGAFVGTGSFNDSITSLESNTTYYFRAYSTNSAGTAFGTIGNFTTNPPSRRIRLFEGTSLRITTGKIKIQ